MREYDLIHERQHNFVLERAMVETAHVDYLKDQFIEILRQTFSQHPEYTYIARQLGDDEGTLDQSPDFDRTKIVITDVYTYDVKFLPVITIRINSSRSFDVCFNQNQTTVDYLVDNNGNYVYDSLGKPIPIYYEYAGAWESQITLNVSAEDTITREELVTFLSVGLFHLKRDEFYTKGIFIKNVSTGGETEEVYANDYIYKQSLLIDTWSEWTHRLPVGSTISGIGLEIDGVDVNNETQWTDTWETGVTEPTVSNLLVRSNGEWNIVSEWIVWWQSQFTPTNSSHLLDWDEYDGSPIPFFVALINIESLYGKSLKQFENETADFRETLTDATQISQLNSIEKEVKRRTLVYLSKGMSQANLDVWLNDYVF